MLSSRGNPKEKSETLERTQEEKVCGAKWQDKGKERKEEESPELIEKSCGK